MKNDLKMKISLEKTQNGKHLMLKEDFMGRRNGIREYQNIKSDTNDFC